MGLDEVMPKFVRDRKPCSRVMLSLGQTSVVLVVVEQQELGGVPDIFQLPVVGVAKVAAFDQQKWRLRFDNGKRVDGAESPS